MRRRPDAMLSNVVLGWLGKMLANIPPEVVAAYINNGRDPLADAVAMFPDQVMFGKSLARPFARLLVGIGPVDVVKKLREINPVAAGVIMNHPKGMEWLDQLLVKVKDLLACEDVVCNSCLQPFPLYPPGQRKYACPYCGAEYEAPASPDRPEE